MQLADHLQCGAGRCHLLLIILAQRDINTEHSTSTGLRMYRQRMLQQVGQLIHDVKSQTLPELARVLRTGHLKILTKDQISCLA